MAIDLQVKQVTQQAMTKNLKVRSKKLFEIFDHSNK
jgi:hypothetical protein